MSKVTDRIGSGAVCSRTRRSSSATRAPPGRRARPWQPRSPPPRVDRHPSRSPGRRSGPDRERHSRNWPSNSSRPPCPDRWPLGPAARRRSRRAAPRAGWSGYSRPPEQKKPAPSARGVRTATTASVRIEPPNRGPALPPSERCASCATRSRSERGLDAATGIGTAPASRRSVKCQTPSASWYRRMSPGRNQPARYEERRGLGPRYAMSFHAEPRRPGPRSPRATDWPTV